MKRSTEMQRLDVGSHGKLTSARQIECARSAQCAPFKHHYDDCVERVTAAEEDSERKGPKEDCVEECTCANPIPNCSSPLLSLESWSLSILYQLPYCVCRQWHHTLHPDDVQISLALSLIFVLVFHLQHCAAACAAPKLFKSLR